MDGMSNPMAINTSTASPYFMAAWIGFYRWHTPGLRGGSNGTIRFQGDNEMQPDAMLLCDKNRHGDWEGRLNLWFHQRSTQYIGHPRDQVMDLRYFPHDGLREAA